MINVYLHGAIGKEFGEVFTLNVKSPIEAVQLLEANFYGKFCKKFAQYSYKVIRGKDLEVDPDYDSEETLTLCRDKDIHFVPVVEGAGSGGIFQIIVGIVIIGLVIASGGLTAGATPYLAGVGGTAFAGISGSSIAMFGASLILGGIAQMLTPTPEMSAGKTTASRPSYLFTGAANTIGQGGCVPVVYGEAEVGSIVISESLSSEAIGRSDSIHIPIKVSITTVVVDSTTVKLKLSWMEADDGYSDKTYVAQIATSTGATWQTIGKPPAAGGDWTTTGLTIDGFTATTGNITKNNFFGVTVWFRVKSVHGAIYSPWVTAKGTVPPINDVSNT